MNIYSIFENAAAENPDRVAIWEGEKSISFSGLREKIDATAAHFLKKGICPGDRILVFVPMSIDLYRTVLAIFKIGAVAVFLDEWVNWPRLNLCCELADCRGFVANWKIRFLAFFSKPLRRIPLKFGLEFPQNWVGVAPKTYSSGDLKSSDEVVRLPKNSSFIIHHSSFPALITFTTGSTGTPKAALRSHGFLKQQFDALSDEIEPRPGDVDMTVLPIVLLVNLGAGATSVIAKFKAAKPEKLDAAAIFQQIEKHKINRLTASPFFVRRLADFILKEKGEGRFSSLRNIFTGGAPVFPSEAALFLEAFPAAAVRIAYGSTEAEPISLVAAEGLAGLKNVQFLDGLPVGKIYRKAEVKIIPVSDEPIFLKENERLENLPTGGIGEIVVAGPHVLASYFKNEEALRRNKIYEDRPQKEGESPKTWHRTGDSGFLDGHGNLFLTGRCSTLFFQDGKLVAPFLIENYLQKLPGVSMGTVMKIGENVVVFVESNDPGCLPEVQKKVQADLKTGANIFRWLEKMPRDPRHNSKIDYEKLREMARKHN